MQAFVPAPSRNVVILRIAEGGMGYIELVARQEGHFSRLFARKRLHPPLRAESAILAMFRDEARLSGLIQHPNVTSVLEVGEDEEGPFLVMEYVEGPSIAQILERIEPRDRLLPVAFCVSMAAQAARGLHSAHQLTSTDGTPLGLVHRDISPKNLLVGYDGLLRVADFGIAKAKGNVEQTMLGVLKGNIGYMAPEYLSFREVDHRSDLFALGVVLYELLTRERLYGGDDTAAIARRILEEPPPDVFEVRDIPPELSALLFDLLAKDPELRPASALEVAGQLEVIGANLAAVDGPFDVPAFLESELETMRKERKAAVDAALSQSAALPPSVPPGRARAKGVARSASPAAPRRVARTAQLLGVAALVAIVAGTVAVRSSRQGRAQVQFEPGAAALWAGGSHNCALRGERLACWGSNSRGQLGDGSLETRSSAVFADLGPVRAAALGELHTCALALDGRVSCWGRNVKGEIGQPTPRLTGQPQAVAGLGPATALVAGRQHTCALLASAKVSCWGANESGQLGRPASEDAQAPAEVGDLPPVERLFAGGSNTCAYLIGGGVRCWGANESGQLGDGTQISNATPKPLAGAHDFVSLALGNNARAGTARPDLTRSAGFMCAVTRNGGVVCWGSNYTAQLGDGTREDRAAPVAVAGVEHAIEVAAGNQHACALLQGGRVSCWGRNEFGAVGDDSMGPSNIRAKAVNAIGIEDAVGLALGGAHSCARRQQGGVLCWGVNNFGQLGDGSLVLHATAHPASGFP